MEPTEYEAINKWKYHSTLSCEHLECSYGIVLHVQSQKRQKLFAQRAYFARKPKLMGTILSFWLESVIKKQIICIEYI